MLHVCIHICMHVKMIIYIYICMCIYICICICESMYVNICIYVNVRFQQILNWREDQQAVLHRKVYPLCYSGVTNASFYRRCTNTDLNAGTLPLAFVFPS